MEVPVPSPRNLFAGLLWALAAAAGAPSPAHAAVSPADAVQTANPLPPAQDFRRAHRDFPKCWTERHRVTYGDDLGRLRTQFIEREACKR